MTNIPTVEDFKALEHEVGELAVMLKLVMAGVKSPLVVKVCDICQFEGVSKTQISGREAYLLPNYGVSEYPDGVKRWRLETYLEWRKRPVEERRRGYAEHLEHVRISGKKNGAV